MPLLQYSLSMALFMDSQKAKSELDPAVSEWSGTDSFLMWKYAVCLHTYVGGSSKIQTLFHMTQVLLELRFTTMERLTVKLLFFIYKCAGILITSIYIYYPINVSHTHLNWHVILWASLIFEFYLNFLWTVCFSLCCGYSAIQIYLLLHRSWKFLIN